MLLCTTYGRVVGCLVIPFLHYIPLSNRRPIGWCDASACVTPSACVTVPFGACIGSQSIAMEMPATGILFCPMCENKLYLTSKETPATCVEAKPCDRQENAERGHSLPSQPKHPFYCKLGCDVSHLDMHASALLMYDKSDSRPDDKNESLFLDMIISPYFKHDHTLPRAPGVCRGCAQACNILCHRYNEGVWSHVYMCDRPECLAFWTSSSSSDTIYYMQHVRADELRS